MVKIYKLHKIGGLSAGFILLILGITGFFIDHDKWKFLYTTTFSNLPQSTYAADSKLYDAYWIDKTDPQHRIVGGKRGIFESFDGGKSFIKMLLVQCHAIKADKDTLYAATADGIYMLQGSTWFRYLLKGEYITSLSISDKFIIAIIDKHQLVQIQKDSKSTLTKTTIKIKSSKLQESIILSRFIRDLHYGRGLFDGDISLLINDYGAIVLSFLGLSGFIIWWFIHTKKSAKSAKKLIKYHANSLALLAIIPLIILSITGIFLDHSGLFAKFMRSITIQNSYLPPVYRSLKHDIWSVDYDEKVYRIGNRYGVYKSSNLKEWELESKGLAYKMIRKGSTLYVSGMGAPNRIYQNNWKILKNTPHMFKDIVYLEGKNTYFSTHNKFFTLPKFQDVTLYSFFLTLHDGTFFSSWWIWLNDYASLILLLLLVTGTMRWYKKKNFNFK